MRKEDKEGIGVAPGDGVNCDGVAIAGDAPMPAGVDVLLSAAIICSKATSIRKSPAGLGVGLLYSRPSTLCTSNP